jgi:zinc protease
VPVLRAEARDGRTTAGLMFRVGRYDETLTTSGVTHLIEHLALTDRTDAPYQFNAEVGGRFTSFFMETADPAHVADFIATVCHGLAADHLARLEHERRVLRTEAASRGSAGVLGVCFNERYGAAGPGLMAYRELGLDRLQWPEVEAWRARWFVSGNAVLWVVGRLPDDLRIPLPVGSAPVGAPPMPLDVYLPGFVLTGGGGIAVSMVAPRSFAASLTLDVLQRRLTQVLRHEHGLSYGVRAFDDRVDADQGHAFIAADGLADQLPAVAHAAMTAIEALADDGCRAEEIEDHVRRLRELFDGPSGPLVIAQNHARNVLDARRAYEPAEVLSAVAETRPDAVAETVRDLFSRAVVATPEPLPAVQQRMPMLPVWSQRVIAGRSVRGAVAALTIGEDGAMLTAGEGQNVTVPYDEVAALLRWNDDKRMMIGKDGFVLRLDPRAWPDGSALLASIEALVSPDLVVTLDGSGPDWGAPSSQRPSAPSAPRPKASVPQVAVSWGLWALLVASTLLGAFAMLGGDWQAWGFVAIGLTGTAWRVGSMLLRAAREGDAAPPPGRGFRILRAVLAIVTTLGVLLWAFDQGGIPVTLLGILALVVQAGVREFMQRLRTSRAGQV